MNLVKTDSFELAIYSKGDLNSPKFALVLPGRLDTKDYPHMRSHVDFLASLGYFALSFDPPGTWESPGDISLYTITNYLKAINELIEHFGDKATFVMGHSRGGSMAMLAGVTNPKVVSFVAVTSQATASEPDKDLKPGDTQAEYRDLPNKPQEKRRFDLPYSFFEDAAKYDMTEKLKTCTKPKLFFWGTKDVTVNPELEKKAYEVSAEPKQLHALDSDHDYRWHPKLIEEVNRVVGDFIKKYER